MTEIVTQYLDTIRKIRRCRPEIKEAAAKLAHITQEEYELLVEELIRTGEDTTLGIVCNLCAANGIRLGPGLTAQVLKVIDPIIDFAPLYRFQDKEAIPPLLETALDEELSMERQVYAALIAAEMTVIHETERAEARRVLRILEQSSFLTPMLSMLLNSAIALLESGGEESLTERFLSQEDIYSLLPKERPPIVIGDGQTMKRSTPKIGRNEPCHCGSGKKYKKCCLKKDETMARDVASPGSPVNRISPARIGKDDRIIDQMRTYELKKLDPAALNSSQLFAAYQRADLFGLRELAFDMLLELEQRPDAKDFDKGHFIDLLDSALESGNIELAKKIGEHIPPDLLETFELTRFKLELMQYPGMVEKLEALLVQEVARPDTEFFDPPLIGLSYRCRKTFPALSIVLARAYIAANLDRPIDVETAQEAIRVARAEIGIDAWDDPIEDIVEWSFDREMEDIREADQSERLNKLIDDAEAAKKEARTKTKELKQKERELCDLSAQLKKEKNRKKQKQAVSVDSPEPVTPPPVARENETIYQLRRRIDRLKGEIGAQQQIRRDLREELRAEKEKSLKRSTTEAVIEESLSADASPAPETYKKILIPGYSAAFRRACETVPAPVAAKAVRAVGEFAAGGEEIWHQTKPVKRIAEYYRIKIDRNFRVLIHWKTDEEIEALDLIPRKELETWIRNNS